MSVEELVQVKPPPAEPIEAGPIETKDSVEEATGMSLPNDLYDFCLRYGSGRFGDTIRIYNPFSPSYQEIITEVCSVYRELRDSEGPGFVPYELFPSSPGLYPWGDDVNGHMMFLLNEGEPEKWPIVLMTVDGEFERLELAMTTFLAKILRCNMSCLLWDESWLRQNVDALSFNPGID